MQTKEELQAALKELESNRLELISMALDPECPLDIKKDIPKEYETVLELQSYFYYTLSQIK